MIDERWTEWRRAIGYPWEHVCIREKVASCPPKKPRHFVQGDPLPQGVAGIQTDLRYK